MDDILITGHKGLIGSRLKKFIRENSENTNIFTLPCKIIYENISHLEDYLSSVKKIDYLYHFADLNGNAKWLSSNKFTQFDANTSCLSIILNLIIKYHPNAKIICLGSAWAYPANKDIVEEKDFGSQPFIKGLESYAKAKIYQYDLLKFAREEKEINFTYFPTCTIFGGSDNSDHLIPTLLKRISANPEKIQIYTDGFELRNFLHVDDLVNAIYSFRDCKSQIMHISTKERISIRNIVDLVTDKLSFKGEVNFSSLKGLNTPELSVRCSELKYTWPSNYKLKKINTFLGAIKEQ